MARWTTFVVGVALALFAAAVSNAETQGKLNETLFLLFSFFFFFNSFKCLAGV